jgi:hypothetical protein
MMITHPPDLSKGTSILFTIESTVLKHPNCLFFGFNVLNALLIQGRVMVSRVEDLAGVWQFREPVDKLLDFRDGAVFHDIASMDGHVSWGKLGNIKMARVCV